MTGAVRAELLKLRRLPTTLFLPGVVLLLMAFGTVGVFSMGAGGSSAGAGFGSGLSAGRLAQPDGYLQMYLVSSRLLFPIIAVSLFAASMAAEYRFATLRSLLTVEPRRHRLLAAKLAALGMYTVIVLVAAVLVAAGAAAVLGPINHVATSQWWSVAGARVGTSTVLNASGSALGWGAIGAIVALMTRSSGAAIGFVLGYMLVAENLVVLAWGSAAPWLPGKSLAALASGGSSQVPYGRAWALAAVYVAAALAIGLTILSRRDVVE